jgi:CRISPR-associated protein Cas2
MRLLVFFDLPVVSKADRQAYTVFRRFLINDGYDMIQFSIYGRILNGNDALEKHYRRLIEHLPPEGSVRCLSVTEKQFAGMKMLVGLPAFQEKKVKINQMLLF